jgi:beta-1,4-mannosyl-glycoprotein beta-1,4-N-acetylglucosaminyltransferase
LLIDTFIFNKDFVALDIRLNELSDSVDYFVISESSFTHSGIPKPLYLSENLQAVDDFKDKVIILSDRRKYFTSNPRTREMIQRQQITNQLRKMKLKDTDIIFHSDCDEIPRASTLRSLDTNNGDYLITLSNYSNYINMQNGIWTRGRATSYSKFKSIQHMRQDIFLHTAMSQQRLSVPVVRIPDFWSTRRFLPSNFPQIVKFNQLQVVENGGWHFNNLISANEIIEKINSSCHTELNSETIRQNAIDNYLSGKEIYTGKILNKVNIDETFPEYVQNNIEKLTPYIFA